MELLDRLIDDFHVDGVVDLVLQACHTYNVETSLVRRLVKEKKGLPYTVVETDYSQADVGQLNTRMAAFIEMLQGIIYHDFPACCAAIGVFHYRCPQCLSG